MGSVPVGRKKRADATGGPQTFRSPTAVVIWWVWLLFAAANLIDLAVQGRDHLSVVAAAILVLATGVAYVTAQRPRIVADSSGVTVVNPLRDHHVGWAGVTNVDLADLLRVHTQDKVVHSWAVQYSRRRKIAADARARRSSVRSGRRSSFGTFGTFGLENWGTARRDVGYGGAPVSQTSSTAEAEAERITRVLNEYATAARAETIWSDRTVEIAGASPEWEPEPAAHIEPAADAQTDAQTAGAQTAGAQLVGWLEPLKSTWNSTAILALLIPALILLVVALV